MSIPTITYTINCKFCGKETGQIELPAWKYAGIILNNEVLGISDSRCSQCQITHGTFNKV